jgi:hypothetical protein
MMIMNGEMEWKQNETVVTYLKLRSSNLPGGADATKKNLRDESEGIES